MDSRSSIPIKEETETGLGPGMAGGRVCDLEQVTTSLMFSFGQRTWQEEKQPSWGHCEL